MAITLAVKTRHFKTVRVFRNVAVTLPEMFETQKFLRATKINKDGKIVPEPAHFWWGEKVDGRFVNIHYYPLGQPLPKPARQTVVGHVEIVTETVAGRSFTRLNLIETGCDRPNFTLDFSVDGERGSRILQCKNAKIVFRRIERKAEPKSEKSEPEFFHPRRTLEVVNNFIEFFAMHQVIIPSNMCKNDHLRACWLLSQLQKDSAERFRTAFQSREQSDCFIRSLRRYVNDGSFRPK